MLSHSNMAHVLWQAPRRGFLKTGAEIVKRETPLGLYKGLGAVLTGIIPKMAIRFTSYEWYKQLLADSQGNVTGQSTFLGMCTEFILGADRLSGSLDLPVLVLQEASCINHQLSRLHGK